MPAILARGLQIERMPVGSRVHLASLPETKAGIANSLGFDAYSWITALSFEAWCDFRFCAYLRLSLLVPRRRQLRAVISLSFWSADRTGCLEKPQANNRWGSMDAIFSDSW